MSKPSTAKRNRTRTLEAQALAMLERYGCPMPYHAVRTHFLGAMCATGPVQPMWNELTVHQDEGHPYRLMTFPARTTRESLACLAETRVEELKGFLTGVFGDQEDLEVPEPMGESLDTLMELDGIFSGMQALLEDPAKPASAKDLEGLRKHITKLTAIAEQEIHAVVLGARVLREQIGALEEKEGSAVR